MAREKERELRELERATRTIFVFNLSLKVDERDLFEFFSKVGRVVDIKLITDKHTRKSRGLGYVEFSKVEEVISAVALTGNLLRGQPVMIKASEAEKNMAWEAAQQQKQAAQSAQQQLPSATSAGATAAAGAAAPLVAGAAAPAGPCWLCVSNLHKDLGEAELQQLFAPFGQLLTVQLVRDPAAANASTGTAYVQFAKLDDAARAMAHWHGRKLVESTLSVTADAPPSVTAGMPLGAPLLPGALLPGGVPLAVPLPGAVPAVAAAAAPAAEPPAPLVVPGELDEDAEGGGLKINAQGRVALMTKLAGGAGLPPPPALVTPAGVPVVPGAAAAAPVAAVAPALAVDPQLMLAQGVLGPGSPIPTPCLMLKNMFDPATAGDGAAASELAAEVEADVRDECSRFGEVVHCWVDAKGKGFVYVRLPTTQAAEAAHRALHGRWYGGRQILAEYQFLQVYNSYFKLAAK